MKEPERPGGVQLEPGRGGLAQRLLQLAEQPGRRAQPGQQLLHRVAARTEPLAGPQVGGGHHQAGVLGRLQREPDLPGRVLRGGLGQRRLGQRRLGQAEAGPDRAGRNPGAVQPRVQVGGQRGRLGLVPRRHHVEAGIVGGQGGHVPFGQGNMSRSTAAPGGQEGGGQGGPRRGVGQPIQGGSQQRPGR